MRICFGVALLVAGMISNAEGSPKIAIGGKAGVAFPLGGVVSARTKTGWFLGAAGEYFLSPRYSIGGDLVWNPYGVILEPVNGDADITVMQAVVGGKHYPMSAGGVYFGGGAGLYLNRVSTRFGPMNYSDNLWAFGLNLCTGLYHPSQRATIDCSLHVIFDSERNDASNLGPSSLLRIGVTLLLPVR